MLAGIINNSDSPYKLSMQAALSDHDALVMMDVGYLLFDPDKLTLEYADSLWEAAPLRAAMTEAMVKSHFCGSNDGSEFRLYCHLAVLKQNPNFVTMFAGLVPPEPDKQWISDDLRAYAIKTVGLRQVQLARVAAIEAMGSPCDDEYFSFTSSQSEFIPKN